MQTNEIAVSPRTAGHRVGWKWAQTAPADELVAVANIMSNPEIVQGDFLSAMQAIEEAGFGGDREFTRGFIESALVASSIRGACQ
jgi:hypothetical protein